MTSPEPEPYDLLVLGSGEAGKYLAWHFAKAGQKVAVIERKYVGGACPNIACLPSKNIIHSAKVASYVRRGPEFGIASGEVRIDMSAVRDRKRHMVDDLIGIHLKNYAGSHAKYISGSGKFIGLRTLEVAVNGAGIRHLHAPNVVINTGTRATLPDIPGLAESKPLTHVEALELDEIPAHLLILGGGYIGLEFAQAMRRFGSRVTIIERSRRLLPREDEDVSAAVLAILEGEGIEVIFNASIERVSGSSGSSVTLDLSRGDASSERIEGSHLLVASGRTPNTDGLDLDLAGVELDPRGYIVVDDFLRTSADGVWAAGDCAGSPHFTHISFDDFRVIRDNLSGDSHATTGRQVPFCMFIDPELARIGLSENEAKAAHIPYRLAKIPMAAVLRTRTLSETQGFIKALVATDSDRILGLTVLGVGAGEIMGAVQIAMLGELPYTLIRDAVLTHPTLLEGLIGLFSAVPPRH